MKLSLDGAKPPTWRRLQLRGDLTLDVVHEYIQVAMGWSDTHLHRFEPAQDRKAWPLPYFLTELDLQEGDQGTPEATARLDQVLRAVGDRLFYTYDFGDDWGHSLTVEKIEPATAAHPPAHCVKAVRACPPEDVGGVWQWNALAAELTKVGDPSLLPEEFEMYADLLPPDVDPSVADADLINRQLAFVGLGS